MMHGIAGMLTKRLCKWLGKDRYATDLSVWLLGCVKSHAHPIFRERGLVTFQCQNSGATYHICHFELFLALRYVHIASENSLQFN